MAKDVDTRKLKDQVAELLKKSKWEKAADLLEQLVRAEPKDMAHRLKLGDTYRRLEQVQKSVAAYEAAAKVFADEGQLIKAIGAVKVILEIDPKNEAAQKQLAEMNTRRFARPTLEGAGLKGPPRGIGGGARATSALELDDAKEVAGAVARGIGGDEHEAPPSDDEPLELDDGKPAPPRKPAAGAPPAGGPVLPQRGFQGPAAPPKPVRPVYDLGGGDELDLGLMDAGAAAPPRATGAVALPPGKAAGPAPAAGAPRVAPAAPRPPSAAPPAGPPPGARQKPPAAPLELDPVIEKLPEDAILADDEADDGGIALDDAPAPKAASPQKPPPPAPPAKVGAPPARPPPPAAEEISFDDVVPARPPPPSTRPAVGPAQPIADLLGSDSEEEIELLSISSDEELAERPTTSARTTPDEMDLDAAFTAMSPAAKPAPRRAPPKKVPLFDDLKQDAFIELVNKLSYHRHVPGQLIIKEGDPGRSFFVIVEGKVRIYKQQPDGGELTLAHLGEGAFFGEMALLSGAPRTANVVAEEDTEILEVTDVVLRELAQNHPAVIHSLKNFYRQRLLNNVMAISPLFKDFDPGERKAIVEKFKMRQAAAGEVLIAEGKNSDGLYVVLHGAVSVSAKKGDTPVTLARLKEGEIFGEMSLLTRKPATATVTSPGNSILLKLPREHFQELVLTHPQILELVSELTEKRRSATDAILSGQGPGHDGMSFV